MNVQENPTDKSLETIIRSIVDQPAAKQSDMAVIALIGAISSLDPTIRAKAFSALALLLRHQTESSAGLLGPIETLLQSTKLDTVCHGLAGLSAVFQLSPTHGLQIIKQDGFLSRLADSVINLLELSPSKNSQDDLNHSLADFLALVMNQKAAREAVRADWSGCVEWLTRIALANTTSVSVHARCAATLALVKLRMTSESPESVQELPRLNRLTEVLLNSLLLNTKPLNTVIEGLALVSRKPGARRKLMDKSERVLAFFKSLLSVTVRPEPASVIVVDTSAAYGIVTVLLHLSNYNPLKSEEDDMAERLRKLAVRGDKTTQSSKIEEVDEDEDLVLDDKTILKWIQHVLNRNNDLMDVMGILVKTESKEVKRTAGKVLLNLVDRQECRGKVLQSGGGRMLMKIIATLTIPTSTNEASTSLSSDSKSQKSDFVLESDDLPPIHALAKILITTNPLLIFGPSPDSPLLLSTVKPLTTLFVHPSATLLQTFESLMALTNLTSLGIRIATEVASSSRVLARLEECLVGIRTGENELVRRAATELICNLSTTQPVLFSFAPQRSPTQSPTQTAQLENSGIYNTRLHLLIALSSSEDLQTSLAASGCLATLTQNSTEISKALISQQKLAESLCRVALDIIEEGKIGVQHRLISVLGNLISEMEPSQLVGSLFKPNLIQAIRDLQERLRDEDEQSKEVKRLTDLLIEELDKRLQIVEVQS